MISIPGLVLIDDNEEELKDISSAFTKAAMPCLAVKFENNSDTNVSGIDHIEFENIEPRVIITDLNLREISGSSPKELFQPIAQMLEHINPSKPYVLFFWSKHDSEIDDVMSLIIQRCSDDFLLPLEYGVIKKSEFKGEENLELLRNKVKALFEETPLFNALYNWENRVSASAAETSLALNKLAKDAAGTEPNLILDKLKNILSKIGNEAVGQKNAKEIPNLAVDLGLAPVLQDRLNLISKENNLWSLALLDIGNKINLEEETKSQLNSFFHSELVVEDYPKNNKGVFVELEERLINDKDHREKFERKIGIEIESLLCEEFITPHPNIEGKTKDERAVFKQDACNSVTLGFIEISADCDQAQGKVKLNRYLLAALIPIKYKDATIFNRGGGHTSYTSHEGIYRAPELCIDGEKYILKLSFKYQFGTVPTSNVHGIEYSNSWLSKPKFRLKEQILNEIIFKCSQYASRPGITGFF